MANICVLCQVVTEVTMEKRKARQGIRASVGGGGFYPEKTLGYIEKTFERGESTKLAYFCGQHIPSRRENTCKGSEAGHAG